eukprot:531392-Pyramimonas_sp.AAC.1
MRELRGQRLERNDEGACAREILSFIALEDGCAIVDGGASKAIMGKESLDRPAEGLKSRGLAPARVDKPARPPRGIGGQAALLGAARAPAATGGKSGMIEFVVTKESLPPLLPGEFPDLF